MTFSHDTDLVDLVTQMESDFGSSALVVACGRLTVAKIELENISAQLSQLRRKVDHGCTDAYCKECDE